LPFVHRFFVPAEPSDETIILLHGSGGSEADLMPFSHRIAPQAILLGVRGRATEEGVSRWFRRFTSTTFDQDDIRAEAAAFAAFVEGAVSAYRLDAKRLVFLGLSNGANFLVALMALHPELIRRAILLRPMQVLEDAPFADLTGSSVLMVSGRQDLAAPSARRLEAWLKQSGGDVASHFIDAGHGLLDQDAMLAQGWIRGAV
jgi:phospholipase/carboxylesterase